jgi:hypothetical protein
MASYIPGSGIQSSGYAGSTGNFSGQGDHSPGIAQAGKEQVKRLGGITKDKVYHQVDGKKEQLVKSLHGITGTLESLGKDSNLGPAQPLIDNALRVIHRVSDRLEHGSTEELVREAQTQIRQRPGVFIAGCVALGFLAGRFMKL